MRDLLAALAIAGAVAPASALPARAEQGPVAHFSAFCADPSDCAAPGATIPVEATTAPLWSGEAAGVSQPIAIENFSGRATLDFAQLGEGDVAGLALYCDADHWLSIQVERIEPADLIAVRLHDGPGGVTAGRLVYTTALGGSFDHKVRLRIHGDGGEARLLFADQRGLWQVLAENVPVPTPASPTGAVLTIFATDGADPNSSPK